MSLILYGFKGCGKTTMGRKLAQELGLPFVDTDELMGGSISELYERLGEKEFRLLEKKTILGLKKEPPKVIAIGGGAILDPENQAHLKSLGKLVYLEVPFEVIEKRLKTLPAFAKGAKSLFEIYHERLPIYRRIADGL
jgi:shikimate kinase